MRGNPYDATTAKSPGFGPPIHDLQEHDRNHHRLQRPHQQAGRLVARGRHDYPCQCQRREQTQPLPAQRSAAEQTGAVFLEQDGQQTSNQKGIRAHVESTVDIALADMETQEQNGAIGPLAENDRNQDADECRPFQQKQQEQRPQQVELLFDGQRPADPHMHPWLNVLWSQRSPIVHQIKKRDGCRLPLQLVGEKIDHRGEDPATIKSGENAVGAAAIEVAERDASGLAILLEQHRRNQEAAEHKKDHDPERSGLRVYP